MLIAEKNVISYFYTNSFRNMSVSWISDYLTLQKRFVVLVKQSVANLTLKISRAIINYVILLYNLVIYNFFT